MANCSVMSSTKSNDSSNQSTLNVSNKIASNQVLLFSEEKKKKNDLRPSFKLTEFFCRIFLMV